MNCAPIMRQQRRRTEWMAADPGLSERIYHEMRKRILAGGFRLRERLDVARLATDMAASATPVREALVRLAAERLILAQPSRGFFAVLWSEAELRSLYQWRSALVSLAVETASFAAAPLSDEASPAERVASAMRTIEQHANGELKIASANADDRLHAARRAEPEVLGDYAEELRELEHLSTQGPASLLRTFLERYHQRRFLSVGAIRERAVLNALSANGGG